MKNLAIIAYSRKAVNEYRNLFEKILGSRVLITTYCMEDGSIYQPIPADLAVISSDDMLPLAKKQLTARVPLVTAVLTISRKGFEAIQALPQGTRALMVNVNRNLSLQCVEQIYHLGATHLELIPYTPYTELHQRVDVAISPGEAWAVPASVSQIVEIGRRRIDISTIVFVLITLGFPELFLTPAVQEYCATIMPANYGTSFPYAKDRDFRGEYGIGAEEKSGVIAFANDGIIKTYNELAVKLVGLSGERMEGRHMLDIFDSAAVRESIQNMKPGQKRKITVRKKELYVRLNMEHEASDGVLNYITLEPVPELPSRGKRTLGQGYTAKYYFSSIVTRSQNMKQLLELAEKNAASESSILICGESGTGKELLAQAIHNASARKNGPFVGLNCASLPESLLESELFGYEEGAFTGASRGGKKGLFEQAEGGTLFLDEIGEMPIHLQTRLLRVLQEKEVMRLGGDSIIDVDVRILAATNRKLREQIREGTFRADLYYRLDVVPLRLPPLRERPEDIPALIHTFQKQLGVDYEFTEAAMRKLKSMYWEGNIRELRNCVEYFANWGKAQIGEEDLDVRYAGLEQALTDSAEKTAPAIPDAFLQFLLETRQEGRLAAEVLKALRLREERGEHSAGRRSLAQTERLRACGCTESVLRGLLVEMEDFGLICQGRGRSGTSLTPAGREASEALEEYESEP